MLTSINDYIISVNYHHHHHYNHDYTIVKSFSFLIYYLLVLPLAVTQT